MALTPQQQQIFNAIDFGSSSGDAWATLGPEGVIAYMQDSLRKRYGTDDLSKIRYIADANVPGGYRLDWDGRQPATGFRSGLRDAARSFGITQGTLGGAAGDAGDGLGTGLAPMNPSEALSFGATWEGKGGTTFSFYRKPDGSLGIKTASANSNDKGDIIAGIATVLGGMAMGGALSGAAGAGAGTVGSGAGFVGEGAASGIGAWDAALASSPSWTAAGGVAGGAAGAMDLGGGISMGADGAITGATPGAASSLTNAGIQSSVGAGATGGGFNLGSAIKSGAASLFGGGGGGGAAGAAGGGWGSLVMPALNAIGSAYTSHQAGEAADAQIAAGDRGIAENRRQFDLVRELLSPYVTAGTGALGSYRSLSGAAGPDAQRAEIAALEGSPQFGSLVKQGENAILQNASATGGLRGGNVQGALADYRTNVLSGLIDKQLGRYGGLLQIGQNSAAGVGTAAMNSGQLNSNLMQQQGAAQAGGIVAGTNAFTNALGGIGGFFAGRGWSPSTTVPAISSTQAAMSQTPAGSSGFGTGLAYGNQDYGQYF